MAFRKSLQKRGSKMAKTIIDLKKIYEQETDLAIIVKSIWKIIYPNQCNFRKKKMKNGNNLTVIENLIKEINWLFVLDKLTYFNVNVFIHKHKY